MRRTPKLLAAVLGLSFLAAPAFAGPQDSVRAALNTSIPQVKFAQAPLADVLDFLTEQAHANVHVDWKSLEAVNITKGTPIDVSLRDVPLRKALAMVLGSAGDGHLLTFYSDGGVLEITSRVVADKQMLTAVFPVEDLIMEFPQVDSNSLNVGSVAQSSSGGGSTGGFGSGSSGSGIFSSGSGGTSGTTTTKADRGQQLVKLIEDTIQPEIWRDNGGPASIRYFQGKLVVTAPRSVLDAIGGSVE